MKLYLLTRKEGCPESSIGGYDQHEGFVLSAETAKKARELAFQSTGTPRKDGSRFGQEQVWLNTEHTECKSIGNPTIRSLNEIAQVILSDYHPG